MTSLTSRHDYTPTKRMIAFCPETFKPNASSLMPNKKNCHPFRSIPFHRLFRCAMTEQRGDHTLPDWVVWHSLIFTFSLWIPTNARENYYFYALNMWAIARKATNGAHGVAHAFIHHTFETKYNYINYKSLIRFGQIRGAAHYMLACVWIIHLADVRSLARAHKRRSDNGLLECLCVCVSLERHRSKAKKLWELGPIIRVESGTVSLFWWLLLNVAVAAAHRLAVAVCLAHRLPKLSVWLFARSCQRWTVTSSFFFFDLTNGNAEYDDRLDDTRTYEQSHRLIVIANYIGTVRLLHTQSWISCNYMTMKIKWTQQK